MNAFGPACNDLIQSEVGRFATFVAAVENGSVEQTSLIMAANRIGSLRALARSFLQNLILQAALRDGHAFLLGIRIEVGLAFSNVCLSLFFLFLREILLQHDLCFAV